MSERHLENDLSKIRADHVHRYTSAKQSVSGIVFDVACGCGYGTNIISTSKKVTEVIGVDIDAVCTDYANVHWKNEKTKYLCQDITDPDFSFKCDFFISFETIEHIENPVPFLQKAAKNSKRIICSVPNQDVIPFVPKKFPFHFRHYTVDEIKDLLHNCGFDISSVKYQEHRLSKSFTNTSGRTIYLEGKSRIFED
jgi:2-polyprenyl-3-methyl-5-hydroxy-6-metoxy-1,4-benzoquinol methylase